MSKILVLCFLGDPTLSPASLEGTGGFNVDSRELVEILSTTDYKITFITNQTLNTQKSYEKLHDNIELYRMCLEEGTLNNQNLLLQQTDSILDFITDIVYREQDYFLIHSLYWYSGYLAFLLKEKLGIPFIHTTVSLAHDKIANGIIPKCQLQRQLENTFLPRADIILSITNSESQTLHDEYNIPTSKIIVLGRPVGLDCKENLQLENEEVCLTELDIDAYNAKLETYSKQWNSGAFLYIGRLVSTKGVKQIILAWYRLYSQNNFIPPLWLVGGSHKEIEQIRNKLNDEIPQLSLLEKSMQICFWGYLPFDIINMLLLRSLVLIEHSRFEAGGRVILEAMSTGTPVIATPFGFAKDLIKNWSNGFLVNYNDINQLSLCMAYFIQQPYISESLGMHAYETYLYYKKIWNYSQRHLEIYSAYFSREKVYIMDMPKLPVIDDYFQKGMIIKYTEKEKKRLLLQFCKENNICINRGINEHKNNNGKSFLWESESYYIKHLYPVFNSASLWNPAIESQILDSELRLRKSLLSSKLTSVIPISYYESNTHIIATVKMSILHLSQLSLHIKDIISKLYSLNSELSFDNSELDKLKDFRHDSFSITNSNSLSCFWQEIIKAQSGKHYSIDIIEISNILYKKSLENIAQHGVNYGKNILEHCVFKDNQLYLLPSASVFWGEMGYDPAHLLYEIILYLKIKSELPTYIALISKVYHIPSARILNWTIMLFVKKYTKAYYMGLEDEMKEAEDIIGRLFRYYFQN